MSVSRRQSVLSLYIENGAIWQHVKSYLCGAVSIQKSSVEGRKSLRSQCGAAMPRNAGASRRYHGRSRDSAATVCQPPHFGEALGSSAVFDDSLAWVYGFRPRTVVVAVGFTCGKRLALLTGENLHRPYPMYRDKLTATYKPCAKWLPYAVLKGRPPRAAPSSGFAASPE